jgi:hypothetical protein
MATLPTRQGGGSGRRRGTKQVTAQDLPNVQNANVPTPNRNRSGQQALTDSVGNLADAAQARQTRMEAAKQRIDKQNNIIESSRSKRDLTDRLSKELKSAKDTLDLTQDKDIEEVNNRMLDIFNENLASYNGTELSQPEYQATAESILGAQLDDLNISSNKLRRDLVRRGAQDEINIQIAAVQKDPDRLSEALSALMGGPDTPGLISEFGEALSQQEELEMSDKAVKDVTLTAINTHLRRMTSESLAKVGALLNTPEAQKALGPEGLEDARDRLNKFNKELAEDTGKQTPAEELEENFNKAVELAQANPDRSEQIFKGFGFEDVDQSDLQQAFEDIDAINKRREEAGQTPLTKEQESSFVSNAVGGRTSVGKDDVLIDAFGNEITVNRTLGDAEIENDNVKKGALTVKAVSEIRRQVTQLVGIPTGAQGEVIGTPAREKLDLAAEAQDFVGKKVLEGQDIAAAVQLWRVAPENKDRLPEDVTFKNVADSLRDIYLPEAAPQNDVGEVSIDQGKKTINDVNSEINSINLDNATGFTSGLVAMWNSIAGNMSDTLVDPEVARDRTNFSLAYRNVVQLLALNPRFAVAEQEILSQMLPGPGVLNTPETARTRMVVFDQLVDKRIAANESILEMGTGAGTKLHQEAVENLGTLYQIKRQTRKFDKRPGGSSVTQFSRADEVDAAEQAEVRKFIASRTVQDLEKLEKEQPELFDAIERKMKGEKGQKPEKAEQKSEPNPAITNLSLQEVEDSIEDAKTRLETGEFGDLSSDTVKRLLKELEEDLARRTKAKEAVK